MFLNAEYFQGFKVCSKLANAANIAASQVGLVIVWYSLSNLVVLFELVFNLMKTFMSRSWYVLSLAKRNSIDTII